MDLQVVKFVTYLVQVIAVQVQVQVLLKKDRNGDLHLVAKTVIRKKLPNKDKKVVRLMLFFS